MINKNNNSDKFMNYIETLIKTRLRKKLDRNINFVLLDEIKKEYEKLEKEIKEYHQWIANNAPSSSVYAMKTSEFTSNREVLFKKLEEKTINLKLFKESLFRKFIEKIKSTIKKLISKKPNNNLNENQLNIEIELNVLKPEFNPEQVNSQDTPYISEIFNKHPQMGM